MRQRKTTNYTNHTTFYYLVLVSDAVVQKPRIPMQLSHSPTRCTLYWYLVLLSDAVRPVLGLELQRGVPVHVVQDHSRGRVQVQALAAGCAVADDVNSKTRAAISDMNKLPDTADATKDALLACF